MLERLVRYGHLANDPLSLAIGDEILQVPPMRQFLVNGRFFFQLLEIGRLLYVRDRVILGALAIETGKLTPIILFLGDLILVVHLSAGHHISSSGRLAFELVAELFGGSAHITALILLLLKVDLLTFEVPFNQV